MIQWVPSSVSGLKRGAIYQNLPLPDRSNLAKLKKKKKKRPRPNLKRCSRQPKECPATKGTPENYSTVLVWQSQDVFFSSSPDAVDLFMDLAWLCLVKQWLPAKRKEREREREEQREVPLPPLIIQKEGAKVHPPPIAHANTQLLFLLLPVLCTVEPDQYCRGVNKVGRIQVPWQGKMLRKGPDAI